jgi:hypothetical protein
MKATRVSVSGCSIIDRRPWAPRGARRTSPVIRPQKYTGKHRMAPSWMTMEKVFQYGLARSIPSPACTIRRCAVELTGRNSVKPSTTPSRTASR